MSFNDWMSGPRMLSDGPNSTCSVSRNSTNRRARTSCIASRIAAGVDGSRRVSCDRAPRTHVLEGIQFLRHALVENFDFFGAQVHHRLVVCRGIHVNADVVDFGAEWLELLWRGRVLGGQCNRRGQQEG